MLFQPSKKLGCPDDFSKNIGIFLRLRSYEARQTLSKTKIKKTYYYRNNVMFVFLVKAEFLWVVWSEVEFIYKAHLKTAAIV